MHPPIKFDVTTGSNYFSLVPLSIFVFCITLLMQGCPDENFTLVKLGNGQGRVDTRDFQFKCPETSSTCKKRVTGEPVFTASPVPGSVFTQWSASGRTSTEPDFKLRIEGEQTLYSAFCATPLPEVAKLTFNTSGSGSGHPRSNPDFDKRCGEDCGEFKPGTIVTLRVDELDGAKLEGWDGCPYRVGNTCVLAVCQDARVTARLSAKVPVDRLTVKLNSSGGTGSGKVTWSRTGECVATTAPCTRSFERGTRLNLVAIPDDDSVFEGWTGACSGTSANCSVTMDGEKEVQANFTNEFELTVVNQSSSNKWAGRLNLDASGAGTVRGGVTTNVAGNLIDPVIDCGSQCTARFMSGQNVIIQALPAPINVTVPSTASWLTPASSTFSFSGCGSELGASCFVRMPRQNVRVTVTFGVP